MVSPYYSDEDPFLDTSYAETEIFRENYVNTIGNDGLPLCVSLSLTHWPMGDLNKILDKQFSS